MNLKAWIFVAKYRIQLHDIYSRNILCNIFSLSHFNARTKNMKARRGTNSDWCYQKNLNEIILKCLFLLLFACLMFLREFLHSPRECFKCSWLFQFLASGGKKKIILKMWEKIIKNYFEIFGIFYKQCFKMMSDLKSYTGKSLTRIFFIKWVLASDLSGVDCQLILFN